MSKCFRCGTPINAVLANAGMCRQCQTDITPFSISENKYKDKLTIAVEALENIKTVALSTDELVNANKVIYDIAKQALDQLEGV